MFNTLPETNSSHLKIGRAPKETIVFQPSISRCELLVSGRVHPRKLTAGGPQNDGLEKVTRFKHGNCWVSMLDFGWVTCHSSSPQALESVLFLLRYSS